LRARIWTSPRPRHSFKGGTSLALGVAPGPEVGRLVRAVEEARDSGEIKERDEALALLRRLVKRS
jgi:hypothetical protein